MKINVPSAAQELGPLLAPQLELLQRKGKQTSDFISMLGRVGTEAVMAHATEGASLGMDEGSSKLTRAVGLSSAMDRISGRVGMAESVRSLLLTKSAIEKEEGTKHHLAFLTTLMRDVELPFGLDDIGFPNPDAEMIRERLLPFIERLIKAHPGKPLIFQRTIYREKRNLDTAVDKREKAKADEKPELTEEFASYKE